MIKVDLITGFLGSGKTTFIKYYVKHYLEKGQKVGIIENDHGAINVDMMLLQETINGKDIEMIPGDSDGQTYRRRFKTKLIAMKMMGYDRIVVEPSGIYDVDHFFDVINDSPINQWYEIGSIIALVDSGLEEHLSKAGDYYLASQIANAGTLLFSYANETSIITQKKTKEHIKKALTMIHCQRDIEKSIMIKDFQRLNEEDYQKIERNRYCLSSYQKMFFNQDEDYQTLFFMNLSLTKESMTHKINKLFDHQCGEVLRIKGFFIQGQQFYQVNASRHQIKIKPINNGQEIIIIIGEKLNQNYIETIMKESDE